MSDAVECQCDDCGGVNPVWFAPNKLWNLVIGGPGTTDDPGGFICPVCFITRAEKVGVQPTAWVLTPESAATAKAENTEGTGKTSGKNTLKPAE